jgi:hypothetical protein
MALTGFFPPPSALHRETKKPVAAILRCAAAASGAVRSPLGHTIAIEAAVIAA